MKKRIALIGYGVIGKRVADAIVLQDDMGLAGVCDVISDWRIQAAVKKEYPIYATTKEASGNMHQAGIPLAGNIAGLLDAVDLAVDCTYEKRNHLVFRDFKPNPSVNRILLNILK
ncbi:MAG: hypothetical protein WEC59_02100 [Salibacteraceae bacterium]